MRAIKNILSLSTILFFSLQAFAQEKGTCDYKAEGIVYDLDTKEPLSFVNVLIDGTTTGTATDEKGYFLIDNLCEKDHDLIFSFLGYKKLIHHHDFHHPFVEIFLAPDELMLEGVVVEAERNSSNLSSSSSSSLSKEQLAAVSSQSLGDVASQFAGVNTISTGQNIVKPVIHGLHSNRILVINNGLRHEFQNWGSEHAPEIDPSLIDEIEVIKGAATVRYGPDALGGVILINAPKLDLSAPLKGEFSLTGKSNGRSGEGTLKLQRGGKWWSVMAEGSYVKQGDLHTPDYLLTNTGKIEKSYAAALRIHPLAEVDIDINYSHFAQELGILRGSVNGNLDDLLLALKSDVPNFTQAFGYHIAPPKQAVVHDLIKVKANYVGNRQSLSLQYGYQINRRKEFDVRKGNDLEIPNINLELLSHSLDLDWKHPDLGMLSGRLGAQWVYQDNNNIPGTNTVPFIPNYESNRFGLYWIEAIEREKDVFEAGLRYDDQVADVIGRASNNDLYRNRIHYGNAAATIGYKKNINQYATFRTNFGTAWRAPNVAELYRFGRHQSFLEYGLWRYQIIEEEDAISTLQILTEEDRPVPAEIGYKWISTLEVTRPNFRAELTGYLNYIENYIFSRPAGLTTTVRGTSPYFIYDQTNALLWGFDLTSELQHSQTWHSTFKGSYLWAKDITHHDNFVGLPPVLLGYDLGYKAKLKGFDQSHFQLFLSYHFKPFQNVRIIPVDELLNAKEKGINLFSEDASTFDILPPPPGYFLANFSWTAAIKKVNIQFQINNLFNTSYRPYTDRIRYFADDLGRNIILSLKYQI
ncbi:MAG: TonB-dependent receptor [Saprospiraceae bacterium]